MKVLNFAAALALLPGSAAACAVCFGNSPETKSLVDGFWWGIILLLSITMTMVGGIGWMLYKVEQSRPSEETPL